MIKKTDKWYSVNQLAEADWFPLKTRQAIVNAIYIDKKLKATKIYDKPNYKRYKIKHSDAINFIDSLRIK